MGLVDFGFIFSGFVVGALVGLTGVGGGSLMTPILVLLFHIHPAFAVGTDLLYASVTKSVGIAVHGKLGNIDWRIVRLLSLGSLPASLFTTFYLKGIDIHSSTLVVGIKFWLGVALLLTSIAVWFRPLLMRWVNASPPLSTRTTWVLTLFLGALLGFLVTLTSVGAGALGVMALLMIYPRLPVQQIVGIDIAHAVPLTLVAGLGHASLGTVDYHLLGVLLIGSIPGIYWGSRLSGRVNEHVIRRILALLLVFVGLKLIFN